MPSQLEIGNRLFNKGDIMIFEFSFGIGGKLGSTIESAIFRSAERKEELNKLRHDVEVARLRNELKVIDRLRTGETMVEPDAEVEPDAGDDYDLHVWLYSMNATAKGNVVTEALIGYYKGRDNIPSMYVGLPVEDTVRLFIDSESEDGEADGYIQLFKSLKIGN